MISNGVKPANAVMEGPGMEYTDTINALLERATNISEIAIALQSAYGISTRLEAAQKMAEGRARNPWVAWANGMEIALTESEYEQLRVMGAEEVTWSKMREYRRAWEVEN